LLQSLFGYFLKVKEVKMQEQIGEKLKEIETLQFITPKEQLGYAEEYITVKYGKPLRNNLLNYSLSNSLEDIKIAIFKRTGLEINIENAKWQINPHLSVSVKDLMNKHQVSCSMTNYFLDDVKIISINMRAGDYWFYTSYGEIDGKCYSWDYLETLEIMKRVLEEVEDRFQSEDENDD
jgi:hypothetical protein